METYKTLEITGYQSGTISNTFVRQSQGTNHLAVVFPGLAYTVTMPVLFYPGRLLSQMGADVLLVDTHYDQLPEYGRASDVEKGRWRAADADAVLEAALAQGSYQRVTLIGKSIGTLAMAHLLQSHPDLPNLNGLWLTPLVKFASLQESIKAHPHHALFVAGTADPHYSMDAMDAVQKATDGEVMVIDGADHSLEIEGDVANSIEVMRQVVEKIKLFLEKRWTTQRSD